MAETKVNHKYRDRLFVRIFGSEENKKQILGLYNVLHHTHYTDPSLLEINTIENAILTVQQVLNIKSEVLVTA